MFIEFYTKTLSKINRIIVYCVYWEKVKTFKTEIDNTTMISADLCVFWHYIVLILKLIRNEVSENFRVTFANFKMLIKVVCVVNIKLVFYGLILL